MAAAKHRLDNLIAIVDQNGQQLDGFTVDVMPIHDMERVFKGFGWHTLVIDGHDIEAIRSALREKTFGMPKVIIAQTVKGKGLPTIEGKRGWHHVRITQEQYAAFRQALEVRDD